MLVWTGPIGREGSNETEAHGTNALNDFYRMQIWSSYSPQDSISPLLLRNETGDAPFRSTRPNAERPPDIMQAHLGGYTGHATV